MIGFLRVIAMSVWVGSRNVAHAFVAANQIPNVLFEVVAGGALSAAMVPVLSEPLAKGQKEQTERIASATITWAVIVGLLLSLLLWAAADPLSALFPSATDEAGQKAAMAMLLRVFAWQIPLYAFGVAATGVLHTMKRFVVPALAPILSSLTVIVAFALYGWISGGAESIADRESLLVLAWGINAGVMALTLPLLVPLWRTGLYLCPRLKMPRNAAYALLRLGGAGIAAVLAQQLATVAIIWGARAFGEVGAQAVFMYSQAVAMLPYAVLVMPIATVMFPTIAQTETAKRAPYIANLIGKVIAAACLGCGAIVAVAPAAASFFTVLTPVPGLALALIAQAPGVLGLGLMFAATRICLACNNARGVRLINMTGWGVVAIASVVLPWAMQNEAASTFRTVIALGAAQSIGTICGGIVGLFQMRTLSAGLRLGTIPAADLRRTVWALVLAPVCAGASYYWQPQGIIASILVGFCAAVPIIVVAIWWWSRGGLLEGSGT